MSTAAIGAELERRGLGSLQLRRQLVSLAAAVRSPTVSPARVAGLSLIAFLIGALATAALAPSTAEVGRLESALFAQAAQLARMGEQITLGRKESDRLAAILRFSTQYDIPAGLAAQIHTAAIAEGLRPEIAFRLVKIESGFRRTAVSNAGAIGLTQLKPSTAQWVDPTVTPQMLADTGTNLRVGFRYLSILLKQYAGNERLALLAYNRGPGRVGELLAVGKDPANGYAQRILSR